MSDTLISILIPIYNHRKYVGTCLDSIYHDAYPEIEVIAIDDGSTDDSWDVVEAWRAAHPGRFRSFQTFRQANQGVCKTLNRLVSLAQGEFLVPLASDDHLLLGGLGLRVDALRQHPEWLALFCDSVPIDELGRPLGQSAMRYLYKANKKALCRPEFISPELILHWSVPGPGVMLRRETFDESIGVGLYDERLRLVEDRDFYLRLLARDALGFVDATTAAYRTVATGTSRNPALRSDVTKALYISNASHIQEFTGLSRIGLRLIAWYCLISDRYHTGGGPMAALAYGAIRVALRAVYMFHTARVHISLCYGGRHARTESVRGPGKLERVERHDSVPRQPSAERLSELPGNRVRQRVGG